MSRRPKPPACAAPLVEQLEELLVRMRRRHPELLGLGFGQRRRGGRLVPETTVKLQVARKRRGRRGYRPFPKHVALRVPVLGQDVTVRVPTDVDTVPRVRPTRFSVAGMRATALATWLDAAGARHDGALTAAHGLPFPDAADPTVTVELAGGAEVPGVVVARADLEADGVDVGLVRIDRPRAELSDVGPACPCLATADELLLLLSCSPTDPKSALGQTWSGGPPALRALAFLLEWELDGVPGPLRRVVQVKGLAASTFKPGTSGSCWVTQPGPTQRVMAVQSHAVSPMFRDAFGSHFLTALEWLQARPGLGGLQVAWKVADLAGGPGSVGSR